MGSTTAKMTVRLIYIHGFQGDHTSFQAFPMDLHEALSNRLPHELAIESCLYPTYKTVRPISVATHNFLDWLHTQPPGPSILLAHSMGGLLAVEAATFSHPASARIKGIVNFDVPFLGMHPHVIISGLASLLPKDQDQGKKSEQEMNDSRVELVNEAVVDDWDAYRRSKNIPSPTSSQQSLPLSRSPSPSGSHHADWESFKATFSTERRYHSSPISRSPSPSPTASSASLAPSTIASSTSALSTLPIPTSISPYLARLDKAASFFSNHADDPILRWLRKHSDDPVHAMVRWVVERFEFGSCMFEPRGLLHRYRKLERWNGQWVNYWTETVADDSGHEVGDADEKEARQSVLPSNTAELALMSVSLSAHGSAHAHSATDDSLHIQVVDPSGGTIMGNKDRKRAKQEASALHAQRASEQRHESARPARHFIVLPDGLARAGAAAAESEAKWELVRIAGAEDEVQAHCGLFIRRQNTEYEQFVERVARLAEGWCRELVQVVGSI